MKVVSLGNDYAITMERRGGAAGTEPLYWTHWRWAAVQFAQRYATSEAAERDLAAELARQPCVMRFMLPACGF